MDTKHSPTAENVALDATVMVQIEQLCDALEAQLREKQPVDLETYLAQANEKVRPLLFRELVLLQMAYTPLDQQENLKDKLISQFSRYAFVVEGIRDSSQSAVTQDGSPIPHEGFTIGCYTLKQRIGEGGMGEVWVAEQKQPVKRKVALKLIRVGMDSKGVFQRFEQERQALALMDHPSIARVYDGGLTESRQPYFVMELVSGLPLNKFCDDLKLSPRKRLELFIPICQAVQHAHQKGIVHRDLKPANILITLVDGKPTPKVIDFGVAKAVSGKLTDETLSTQFGAVVGTLEYMSPEQAGLTTADVDTRADIYSLGVILYELLTGLRPFDAKRLKMAAMDEIIRIIKEEEPPSLASRLSTDESLPSVAALRQLEPAKLLSLVKGELDWIVLKCLEKDRNRRYESAIGLARDVERYLQDEPVEARPVSAGYRFRKFVSRHRGQVFAAGLVLLTLIAGIIGTSWGLLEAKRSEKEERLAKEEAERSVAAEKNARMGEEQERKYAQAIAMFVKDDFLALTSVEGQERFEGEGLDRESTLLQLLNRAADKLLARRDLEPLIEAELCWIVGVSYRGIGEPSKGVPFLERTVVLRRQFLGSDDSRTLNAMNSLATCYSFSDHVSKALPLYEETLRLVKDKLGRDHIGTLTIMNDIAVGYHKAGKLEKALPLYEEALLLAKANLGIDHLHTLTSMCNLAKGYRDIGQQEKAVQLWEEVLLQAKTTLGNDHSLTLSIMNNLASGYGSFGQVDKALPLFEETFRKRMAKLGQDHPSTLTSMNNLALSYRNAGRIDKALPLLEETLRLRKAKMGPDHSSTLTSMHNLASGYASNGKYEKALPLYEETLKLKKAKLGRDHPDTLTTMSSLATCHWSLKQLDKSVPLFEELLPLQEKKLGRPHPATQLAMANLGVNYRDAGRLREAIPLLQEAYLASRRHPSLRWVREPLIDVYTRIGNAEEAIKLIVEEIDKARTTLPKDSPQLAVALDRNGMILLLLKQFTSAEKLFRECLAIREKGEPENWRTFNTQLMLGETLLNQKKYVDANPHLLKGFAGMKACEKTIPHQAKIRLTEALDRLIQFYTETNKPDEVKKWQAEKDKLMKSETIKK